MERLLNWFRKHVMGTPDTLYRPNRDPLVLHSLRLEKKVQGMEWRPRDLFDVR